MRPLARAARALVPLLLLTMRPWRGLREHSPRPLLLLTMRPLARAARASSEPLAMTAHNAPPARAARASSKPAAHNAPLARAARALVPLLLLTMLPWLGLREHSPRPLLLLTMRPLLGLREHRPSPLLGLPLKLLTFFLDVFLVSFRNSVGMCDSCTCTFGRSRNCVREASQHK